MPGYVRILLILISSAGVVVSFPPFDLPALALIGWIPFLAALRGLPPAVGLLAGILHGLIDIGLTLVWLLEIFGPMAVLLHFLLASFTGLFGCGFCLLTTRPASSTVTATWVALPWTGIEYLRSEWFHLRFPWITPGTALPPSALTPWAGVYGVSLIVVFMGSLCLLGRGRFRPVPIAGLALIGGIAF